MQKNRNRTLRATKRQVMKTVKFIMAVLVIGMPLSGCTSIRYKTSHHSQPVILSNGQVIDVDLKITCPKSISIPFITHGDFFFGKKHIYEYSFSLNGITISKKGNEEWLLLNIYDDSLYIWTTTLYAQNYEKSKLYKYDMKKHEWQQVDRTLFPKAIAVQNLPSRKINRVENDVEIARKLDPHDRQFRKSPTAHLWLMLEKGTFIERSYWEVKDVEFLKDFKKKYLNRDDSNTDEE